MVNRSLLFSAVVLFTVTALEHAPAVWRGPPQMLAALDGETRDWVQALGNKFGGGCCDTADGFPVEVDGWDMAGTVDDTLANDRVGCQVRPERLSRSAGPMANGTTCRITRCSGPDRTAFPMLGALARRDRAA
jgi:hypothetical protein